MNTTPAYVLGHTDFEIERLQLQAGVLADVTRRLIRECGIGPGMYVLDIGCGVGDVSMLLAEAVGEAGSVVAFDREAHAVEMAQARALAAGYRQVEFVVASDDAFPEHPAFDAAIGRYVLHHQADPVAMIRRAAKVVRPGGVVAFHEPAGHVNACTLPTVDLYVDLEKRLNPVFNSMLPHRDVGGRLIACFEDAGLPTPNLIWESIAGGSDSPLWRLFAMTYRSMLPHFSRLGLAPADEGDPDTLADRLVAAAAAVRAQIVSKPLGQLGLDNYLCAFAGADLGGKTRGETFPSSISASDSKRSGAPCRFACRLGADISVAADTHHCRIRTGGFGRRCCTLDWPMAIGTPRPTGGRREPAGRWWQHRHRGGGGSAP